MPTTLPNYTVKIAVELYGDSAPTKFNAFASRLNGQNIGFVSAKATKGNQDLKTYTFDCTPYGVAILLDRWTKRLGSGMQNATVSVAPQH